MSHWIGVIDLVWIPDVIWNLPATTDHRRKRPRHSGDLRMSDADDIFPLPLSNFEYYAFRDDSPEYPMVMAFRTPFEGTLDETAFSKALHATLHENPLFRAVVDESFWRTQWRLLDDFEPSFTCSSYDQAYPPDNCPPRWIDLTKEAGAVFELRLSPTRGVLISHFHHACADGISAIRFLGDVFAHYGRMTAADEKQRPTIRKPDPTVLLKRGATSMPGERRGRSAPILHTLIETCRLLFRKCYRVKRHLRSPIANGPVENIVHTTILPRTFVRQLKESAADKGVSTNDLLMTIVFQQMAAWSADDPASSPNDLFRFVMPVSMRTPDHDAISAANVLSYVFHSYRRRQILQPQALLAAIHRKSQQMINRNEGAAMLHGFALTRWVPGLFRLSQKLQPDYATAVMTNVGEVRRLFDRRFPLKRGRAVAGNVIIQSVDGIAPVRSNTNITVSFGAYGGELIMNLNRNTQLFSDAEAEDLLAQLAERLKTEVSVRDSGDANSEPSTGPGPSLTSRIHEPPLPSQKRPQSRGVVTAGAVEPRPQR